MFLFKDKEKSHRLYTGWVVVYVCLFLMAAYVRMALEQPATVYFVAALAVFLLVWILMLIEIINYTHRNKFFWVVIFLAFPFVGPVFYLFQRKRLVHYPSSINS